jgi:D-sedoheptulose 7-phosphate isomerase
VSVTDLSGDSDPLRVTSAYLADLRSALDGVAEHRLANILNGLRIALANGKRVFAAGNGGSASTASHFASDVQSALGMRETGVAVVSLVDNTARLTALANDVGYEHVFACQISSAASPGDVLLCFSVSGASPNLLEAARTARGLGMRVYSLLGGVSPLADLSDQWVSMGEGDYGVAEDLHLAVNHMMVRFLRNVHSASAIVLRDQLPADI